MPAKLHLPAHVLRGAEGPDWALGAVAASPQGLLGAADMDNRCQLPFDFRAAALIVRVSAGPLRPERHGGGLVGRVLQLRHRGFQGL